MCDGGFDGMPGWRDGGQGLGIRSMVFGAGVWEQFLAILWSSVWMKLVTLANHGRGVFRSMVPGAWCVGMIPRNPVAKCMLENCRFGKSRRGGSSDIWFQCSR